MSKSLEFFILVVGETFEYQFMYDGTQKIVNFFNANRASILPLFFHPFGHSQCLQIS